MTQIQIDLAKFDGKPPYDGPENICRNDNYFLQYMLKRWGVDDLDMLRKIAK